MTRALLLIPYGLFLIFCMVMFLSALYHVVRFGFVTKVTVAATVTFLMLTAIVLFMSFYTIVTIDWSAPLFANTGASP